jgi:hypothetical protein
MHDKGKRHRKHHTSFEQVPLVHSYPSALAAKQQIKS